MKKLLLLSVSLLLLGICNVYSQSSNEPIVIDKATIGHRFYHGDRELKTVNQVKAVVANDQLALEEVKKATAPEVFSYIFAFAGGFMIGWEIGGLIWDRFNPYVLVGGVGLVGVAYGFAAIANNKMFKGIQIYNSNLETTAHSSNIKVDFGLVRGGIGLTMTF
ncbi:MAG: hypothetical protein SPK72_04215 [Bacteroidales bacterium]|nr:hypothetical protein [Bacteroidales bacterium]